MWPLRPEQEARIQKIVAAMLRAAEPLVSQIEDAPRTTPGWRDFQGPPTPKLYRAVMAQLRRKFRSDLLGTGLAEVVVYPEATGLDFAASGADASNQQTRACFVWTVAAQWTIEHLTQESAKLLAEYLSDLLRQAGGAKEDRSHERPGLEVMLDLLDRAGGDPEGISILDDLVTGSRRILPPAFPPAVAGRLQWIISRYCFDGVSGLDRYWQRFLRHLHIAGRLTYEVFWSAAMHFRGTIRKDLLGAAKPGDPFEAALWEHHQRFAREIEEDLTPENAPRFAALGDFWGARSVARACKEIERLGIKRLRFSLSGKEIEAALFQMANVRRILPEDDPRQIVAELKPFRPETLTLVYPVAGAAREMVFQALGWDGLRPLLEVIEELAGETFGEYGLADVPNCDDPASGVVDRQRVVSVLQQVDPTSAASLFQSLQEAKSPGSNAATLVAAAAGWNRPQVLAGLKKRNQTAVKAYGLLPFDEGEEAMDRYRVLRRFEREAKKHRVGQQTNERAAVQAALANLAQTAKYADAAHLEWAMEGRLADASRGPPRTVGPYEVRLDFEGRQPRVVASKKGNPLKAVPAQVRESDEYRELVEMADALGDQAARSRDALEGLMAAGRPIDREDLARLAEMPAAALQLGRLLLEDEAGRLGLLDCREPALEQADGGRTAVRGPLKVVHPFDLLGKGLLADWQREIVRRRIVQPFKQAFRELYVLTPAEEETRTFSQRFSGHVLNSRVAAALLSSRGWRPGEICHKAMPAFDLRACFLFSGVWHFFTESPTVTSDQMCFVAAGVKEMGDPRDWLPLAEVPSLALSEAMRDADLVVSVAQTGEQGYFSPESYRSRAETVGVLIEQLGIRGVTIDGHFLRVAGKLARYRLHLGSAAIHIEPGHYLCVVPARSLATKEPIYLPFAEGSDQKAAEVISKMFLLLNDDRIKDASILGQIRAAQGH